MPGIALPATTGLWCVLGFLGLAGLAVAVGARRLATPLIYGGSLAVAVVALGAALTCFLDSGPPWTLVLPIGLPGIGAHFRVDALSAFFLVVVNLGGAVTSLYALGYGRHEESPARVLPFYAAFLGAMNLVVIRRRRLHLSAGVGIHVAHLVGDRAGALSTIPPTAARPSSIS